jgi:hypothetical protein
MVIALALWYRNSWFNSSVSLTFYEDKFFYEDAFVSHDSDKSKFREKNFFTQN